jgi:two-component system invasion response regulator UvrY
LNTPVKPLKKLKASQKTMQKPITIILVDDHELIRESWKFLFDKDPSFNVIAQCRNGAEAIEQAALLVPDIMLMDINMSPVNGFEATKRISETTPSVRIIGVSANNNIAYATKMISHGAKGFVTKTSEFVELKTAIQKVFEGENYICIELRKKPTSGE